MSKQTAEQAAEEYIKPFAHQLHFGQEESVKNDFVAGANWQASQSPWIDVKDALPERGQAILSYTPLMRRATIDQYTEYPNGKLGFKFKDVTHWQAMPEPPTK